MSSQLLFSLVLLQVTALGALGQLCTQCPNVVNVVNENVKLIFNNTINADGCKEVTMTCIAVKPDCAARARIMTKDTKVILNTATDYEGTVAGFGAIVCKQQSSTSADYNYNGTWNVEFTCKDLCEGTGGSGGGGAVTIEETTEDPTTKMPAERGCKVQK
ncbi:hypothetical protein GCK72_021776 [Caenorhabditis remanei]|uniref:Uncharacterized protein n=1 Tax=Caenorhabditis remanei TaxID=31234 RepID=A0A2P4WV77_CAERE|nr:hypothetical protein GCK72_021776 [Caenorhabditis remanei]KAF1755207.1 hypothetical protein GCK72_021776 [Caenorhabditis remanei]